MDHELYLVRDEGIPAILADRATSVQLTVVGARFACLLLSHLTNPKVYKLNCCPEGFLVLDPRSLLTLGTTISVYGHLVPADLDNI